MQTVKFGYLASAWARLAVDVGETEATLILVKEWGAPLSKEVIEGGLLLKTRFSHMNNLCNNNE